MESMSHTGPAPGEHPLPPHPQSWGWGALLCPGQRKRRMGLSSAFRNRFVLNSRTVLWEEGSCLCSYHLSQGIFGKDAPGCSSHQWGDSICPQHFPGPESGQYLPATCMLDGGQGTRQVHHCPALPAELIKAQLTRHCHRMSLAKMHSA